MSNDINNTVIETTTNEAAETKPAKAPKVKRPYPFLTKKQILSRLENDASYVEESLLVLYARQTSDERENKDTKYKNRRGFMSSHAKPGVELAEKILNGEGWSDEDFGKASSIVSRYSKQLAKHHRESALAENPELAEIAALYGC